jgi:energy-coupling factor transport system permease protein
LLSIALTLVLQVLLGTRTPGHVLVDLPSAPLPHWSGGLTLGGPITGEALLNSFDAGLRLAVLITCFGAANALAHPARLLRILPAALYEVGVAIVVALTFIPQLAESLVRVRAAQRLRGRPITGLRGLRGIAVPVLEESLERAIGLAASMDSRGYGRRGHQSAGVGRVTAAAVLTGFGAAIAGSYQLIDPGTNHTLGLALLVAGTGLAMAGGLVAGRRTRRTRYRPDPWRWPEWLVVGSGVVVVVVYQLQVHDSTSAGLPLAWPTLPLAPFLATLVAAVPAFATPTVPDNVAPPLRLAVVST